MANGTHDTGGQASAQASFARTVLIDLAVMSAIGLALALIGPLGSYAMPFAERLIYWMVMCYAGYFCYRPLSAVILRLAPKLDLPEWPLWIFAVLVATIPMAIIVWTVGYLSYGEMVIPTVEQAVQHYFNVLVIGTGVTLVFYLVNRDARPNKALSSPPDAVVAADQQPTPQAAPEPAPVAPRAKEPVDQPATPRFFDRLPPALGTDLLALEMEDHYVRAHTTLGSDLILLRMRDAVAELDTLDGKQVHRSWWVARSAVEGTHREGRNLRLKLTGGLEAPVSRNMAPVLKEAGWL